MRWLLTSPKTITPAPYCLPLTLPQARKFAKEHKLVSELFYADGVPLKTMVRANPGIILLKNGTVVNKWHFHNMPKYEDLVKNYL
jgi:hypothetical protein